jgi:hypothetical protein
MTTDRRESGMAMKIGKALAVAVLATCMMAGCDSEPAQTYNSRGMATPSLAGRFTSSDTDDHFRIVTDIESGVQYVIWTNGMGKFEVGGISPLVDQNGDPMLAPGYERSHGEEADR